MEIDELDDCISYPHAVIAMTDNSVIRKRSRHIETGKDLSLKNKRIIIIFTRKCTRKILTGKRIYEITIPVRKMIRLTVETGLFQSVSPVPIAFFVSQAGGRSSFYL